MRIQRKVALWKNKRHMCAFCGKTGILEIDHVFPKSLGGSDNIKNLQLLCRSCNASKSNRMQSSEEVKQK